MTLRTGNRQRSDALPGRPAGFREGCRSSDGFTLIEVLITLVILSVSIVAVLQAFETAAVSLGRSRDVLWSHLAAKERLAQAVMDAESGGGGIDQGSGGFKAAGVDFRWELQSEVVQKLPPEIRKQDVPVVLSKVGVTIWREGGGAEQLYVTYLRTGRLAKKEALP